MKTNNQFAIRTYTRAREDFQAMRKRMMNRLGVKADGTKQKIPNRLFDEVDIENFTIIAKDAERQEKQSEKMLLLALKREPIYTQWLKDVRGVGPVSAGHIIGNFDIEVAMNVSKMTQYAGLNADFVRGKKRVEVDKYKPFMGEIVKTIYDFKKKPEAYIIQTNEMIRGDKPTPGFTLPYNAPLRAVLLGVMADGFIKHQNHYAMEFYYPYKQRLENSDKEVLHLKKMVPWKDVSKGHRDRAAKRKMIKEFLKDLYQNWRSLEGLSVRCPYAEEYLEKKHSK